MGATRSFHTVGRIFLTMVVAAIIAACSPSGPTTPAEGSAEREAIYTAMREGREIQDQVFVASDFKVQNGWAWVTAAPQSKDGSQHYETESWLLQKTGDTWKVTAQPCAEEGCELPAEIAKMRQAHPDAPETIFPK
jgi:hypothetical protein